MTRKDRKRYSREFKLEAVRRCDEAGKPVTQVARELGISVHHLYRWRDEFIKQGEKAFPGCGKPPSIPDELSLLRRENARLREERDILKKSLIFFAKEQGNDIDSSKSTDRNSQ